MENFQVPQYIEEESRLVGPFSFTQIIILAIGCGLSYVIYTILTPWLAWTLIVLILGLTVIFTFGKIEGLPAYKLIVPLIKHLWLPKTYLWHHPASTSLITNKPSTKNREPVQHPSQNFTNTAQTKKPQINTQELSDILNKGKRDN